MGRPQGFDEHQVLENAMQVFWRKGYAGTSMRDLTEATHLQPGSLYGAFSNKRRLFLLALEYYFSALHRDVDQLLDSDEPPLERIRAFFQALLDQSRQDPDTKGCLLVNTLLEVPPEDRDVNRRVSAMLKQVERDLCGVLQQARARGDLDDHRDPAALARLLISGIFGLRVYNRLQHEPAELQSIVDELLSMLEA